MEPIDTYNAFTNFTEVEKYTEISKMEFFHPRSLNGTLIWMSFPCIDLLAK